MEHGRRFFAAIFIMVVIGAIPTMGFIVTTTGGSPGDLAETLLDTGGTVVIEIDYDAGTYPNTRALAALEQRAAAMCQKDVRVVLSDEIYDDCSAYTVDDIRALEARYRDHHNDAHFLMLADDERTTYLYILCLDGVYRDNGGTLGLAYSDSSLCVFQDAVTTLAMLVYTADQIEEAVLIHEFGHLLGLVSESAHSASDDQGHPGYRHCNNASCIMHQSYFTTVLVSDTLPTDFCDECRRELEHRRH